jgi:transposase
LDQWLAEADDCGIKEFAALSRSFRTDYQAIKAGLTLPWSTAQCEGQITRVKLIKRMGYGRAKPDLLRQRVLHRSAA